MEWVERITAEVEPLQDSIYGPLYRCSLTLKDGTFLPCAVQELTSQLADRALTQAEYCREVLL
jgi:hypothetical protein